jgi:hypothetical protein
MPLSVKVEAGAPWAATAALKVARMTWPVVTGCAVTDSAYREWSSIQDTISTSRPPASCQWMKSDCHRSLGSSAANRIYDDLGRFFGSGVTRPCRARYRLMVAADTFT